MYTLFYTDPATHETETEIFTSIDEAMKYAMSQLAWELYDANSTRLAHGFADRYRWHSKPDNCPPWW